MIRATNSENSTDTATVSPNCLKYWPGIPPMKLTGAKTATMEKLIAITVRPISLAASSDAS